MQLAQNAPPAPKKFPDIKDKNAVKEYFEILKLHELNDSKFNRDNLKKRNFTLALYKLIFQEYAKNSDEYEHDGVTLRYLGAGWCKGVKSYQASRVTQVGKKRRYWAYSAHFKVTLKDKLSPNSQVSYCYIWVYPSYWVAKPTLRLNIHVKIKLSPFRPTSYDWRLKVSEPEVVWNQNLNHWEVNVKKSGGTTPLDNLGHLPVAKEITWGKSKEFLANLLRHAVKSANKKIIRDGASLGKALEKAGLLGTLEKVGVEALGGALREALSKAPPVVMVQEERKTIKKKSKKKVAKKTTPVEKTGKKKAAKKKKNVSIIAR